MHPACECRGASQNATAVAERCSQVGFCAGPRGYQMEHIIDIQLVKEQLRLLGHHVADDVILAFVKGLNSSSGAGVAADGTAQGTARFIRTPATAAADTAARDTAAVNPALRHIPAAKTLPLRHNAQDGTPGAVAAATPSTAAGRGDVAADQTCAAGMSGHRAPPVSKPAGWQGSQPLHHASAADATPSQLGQAPDQASPKRLLQNSTVRPAAAAAATTGRFSGGGAASPAGGGGFVPAGSLDALLDAAAGAPAAVAAAKGARPHIPGPGSTSALDKRCRSFLARHAYPAASYDDTEQPLQQQKEEEQKQVVIPREAAGAPAVHLPDHQLSSCSSAELLLELQAGQGGSDAGRDEGVSDSGSECCMSQLGSVLPAATSTGTAPGAAAAGRSSFSAAAAALQQRLRQGGLVSALAGNSNSEAGERCCSTSDDGSSSSSSSCDGLDGVGGSGFLLQQAAAMQRVRAQLSARLAGSNAAATPATAAAAATCDGAGSFTRPATTEPWHLDARARHPEAAPGTQGPTGPQALPEAFTGTSSSGGGSGSNLPAGSVVSPVAYATTNEASARCSLPPDSSTTEPPARFGFRQGYVPVGINMPPPPSSAAVEALAAARKWRQQQQQGPGGGSTASSKPATAQHQTAAAAAAAAVQRLHALNQRPLSPVTLPSLGSIDAGGACRSVPPPLCLSPAKGPCGGGAGVASVSVGSAQPSRSGGSIIGGDSPVSLHNGGGGGGGGPGGSSSSCTSRGRHSPRVDPLFHAPPAHCGRSSNPTTPRSSPAPSPVPVSEPPQHAGTRAAAIGDCGGSGNSCSTSALPRVVGAGKPPSIVLRQQEAAVTAIAGAAVMAKLQDRPGRSSGGPAAAPRMAAGNSGSNAGNASCTKSIAVAGASFKGGHRQQQQQSMRQLQRSSTSTSSSNPGASAGGGQFRRAVCPAASEGTAPSRVGHTGSASASSSCAASIHSSSVAVPGGRGSSSTTGLRSVSHESQYCQRLQYGSQRSTVAPGVRKTDRVARFQQMQQQWQRDRFLSSGGGGAASSSKLGAS